MDGQRLECDVCGNRIPSMTLACPCCGCGLPHGWHGVDDLLKARHPALRLMAVAVAWVGFLGSVSVALLFTSLFLWRLA